MSSHLSPSAIALTYMLLGAAVIPLGFAMFRTPFKMWEVLVAASVGAALSFIPTVGDIASLAGPVGVLFWRLGRGYSTDICVSVGVARLVMLPVLLLLSRS
jgi:hypothetical protein